MDLINRGHVRPTSIKTSRKTINHLGIKTEKTWTKKHYLNNEAIFLAFLHIFLDFCYALSVFMEKWGQISIFIKKNIKNVKNYRFEPSKNAIIAAPVTKREFESSIPGKKFIWLNSNAVGVVVERS